MTDDHPVKVSGAKEELFSQFNQAIITARSYTNQYVLPTFFFVHGHKHSDFSFESEVAQPVAQVFVKLFEERPVLAVSRFLTTDYVPMLELGIADFPWISFRIQFCAHPYLCVRV